MKYLFENADNKLPLDLRSLEPESSSGNNRVAMLPRSRMAGTETHDSSAIPGKQRDRAALLDHVSHFMEAVDRENKPLTPVQDAAVMEIVREVQRLEMQCADAARHKKAENNSSVELMEGHRISLIKRLAELLDANDIIKDRDLETVSTLREAQRLERAIDDARRGRQECCGVQGMKHLGLSLSGGKMKADRIEISWDDERDKWLIRICVGEEVIRRYSEQPRDSDRITLQSEALNLAAEEGYNADKQSVVIEPLGQ